MPFLWGLRTYLLVAIGGAIGSIARYWLGNLGDTLLSSTFPWGILIVNVLGCFVIGFFSEATGANGMLDVAPDTRSFVIVGLCGGFTTFSSFSLGTITLLSDGHVMGAIGNVSLSLVTCLTGVAIGIWLTRFTKLSTETMEDRRV
ncbi:MAG TPA: fluoride efflux transporter CrcB [Stellaceae bacterium]|jgi:CrcB protein|nr:fluoride efflux transporter CrcB [Stellaceae bacterium]